jgi:hypothetical protein
VISTGSVQVGESETFGVISLGEESFDEDLEELEEGHTSPSGWVPGKAAICSDSQWHYKEQRA